MRITGTVVFVRTEMEPKPLNVRCAMLGREHPQGNAWQIEYLFVLRNYCLEDRKLRSQCVCHASRIWSMFLLSSEWKWQINIRENHFKRWKKEKNCNSIWFLWIIQNQTPCAWESNTIYHTSTSKDSKQMPGWVFGFLWSIFRLL